MYERGRLDGRWILDGIGRLDGRDLLAGRGRIDRKWRLDRRGQKVYRRRERTDSEGD